MGFDFSGFVLRAPRTAPSNFRTTDEASNGVDRDFKPLSEDYSVSSPDLVEISADQYRAAVLLRTDDGQGPAYLVYDNFRVLMAWNRSTYFGLTVGQLSELIAYG